MSDAVIDLPDGPVVPRTQRVSAWRRGLAALALCWLWVLYWYADTVAGMVGIWYRSETFAHGFVVPPIVAWLVWRRRQTLARLTPQPSVSILGLAAIAALAWLLGDLALTNAVTQLAFVMMLVLTVPAVLGMHVASALAFPLAFMLFMVPIGEFVMPHLMDWTAKFTVYGLRASGIPVFQEGRLFVIPSGTWSVVEACSGVRYLIASAMVGTLFAYLNYSTLKRRLIFVGVSLIVPIVANWLRAYLIVMIGHLSNNELATGVDHLIYGWVFFGIVIVTMFLIGARWAEAPAVEPEPVGTHAVPIGAGRIPSWMSAALVASIAFLPHVVVQANNRNETAAPSLAVSPIAVETLGHWQAGSAFADWRPTFKDPSGELTQFFSADSRMVGLYIAYYRDQGFERKLVSSVNSLVRSMDNPWAMVAEGVKEIKVNADTFTMRTAQLRRGLSVSGGRESRIVVWHWYWINGRMTSNPYWAKLLLAQSRLLGRGDDSAMIVLFAPLDGQDGEAALGAFVNDGANAIVSALRQTKAARVDP